MFNNDALGDMPNEHSGSDHVPVSWSLTLYPIFAKHCFVTHYILELSRIYVKNIYTFVLISIDCKYSWIIKNIRLLATYFW